MKFKAPHLEREFHELLHPKVRALLIDFAYWSEDNELPAPVVSAVSRKWEWYDEHGLGRPAFSWHLCNAAVDLRDKHYSGEQYERVAAWFRAHCPYGPWELITALHGTGSHLHIARRDLQWRADWQKRNQPKQGVQA